MSRVAVFFLSVLVILPGAFVFDVAEGSRGSVFYFALVCCVVWCVLPRDAQGSGEDARNHLTPYQLHKLQEDAAKGRDAAELSAEVDALRQEMQGLRDEVMALKFRVMQLQQGAVSLADGEAGISKAVVPPVVDLPADTVDADVVDVPVDEVALDVPMDDWLEVVAADAEPVSLDDVLAAAMDKRASETDVAPVDELVIQGGNQETDEAAVLQDLAAFAARVAEEDAREALQEQVPQEAHGYEQQREHEPSVTRVSLGERVRERVQQRERAHSRERAGDREFVRQTAHAHDAGDSGRDVPAGGGLAAFFSENVLLKAGIAILYLRFGFFAALCVGAGAYSDFAALCGRGAGGAGVGVCWLALAG